MPRISRRAVLGVLGTTALWSVGSLPGQEKGKAKRAKAKAAAVEIVYPPELPGGKSFVTDTPAIRLATSFISRGTSAAARGPGTRAA